MKTALALCLSLLTHFAPAPQRDARTSKEGARPRLSVPEAAWEPIFFKEIRKRARKAKLGDLRASAAAGDDLEARVWAGFGLTALEGFVISRASGRWSAAHLAGLYPGRPEGERRRELAAPKSGWEGFWKRVTDEGLLTLPDASEAGCNTHVKDGTSYVVEVSTDGAYRTYMYDNPSRAVCVEAKRVVRIREIVAEEFGLKDFGVEE